MKAQATARCLAERRHRVVTEALSWLGTPYHHQADLRGVGVDCAMLLVRVFEHCGFVPPDLDPRPYSPEWHLHRSEEAYLGWLERYAIAQHQGEPAPGDVVVWRYGRTFSHGAIVIGDGPRAEIVHALRTARAVVRGSLDDPELRDRPACRYRLHQLCAEAR